MKTTYIGYFGRTQNVREPGEAVDAGALARLFAALPDKSAAPKPTLVKDDAK